MTDQTPEARLRELPRAKECPFCKRVQLMALAFCGHCGKPYGLSAPAPQDQEKV